MMYTKETRKAFKDIWDHATKEEKTQAHVFAGVTGFLIVVFFAGPITWGLYWAFKYESFATFIISIVLVMVGIPILVSRRNKLKKLLYSTRWAREQGYDLKKIASKPGRAWSMLSIIWTIIVITMLLSIFVRPVAFYKGRMTSKGILWNVVTNNITEIRIGATETELLNVLGEPDNIETLKAGDKRLSYYRYALKFSAVSEGYWILLSQGKVKKITKVSFHDEKPKPYRMLEEHTIAQ